MIGVYVVRESNSKNVVGLSMRGIVKRIDVLEFGKQENLARQFDIAWGINEIMDFLEKNVPIRNGKFYRCKNCQHTTMYQGDLDCCDNPDFEEMT